MFSQRPFCFAVLSLLFPLVLFSQSTTSDLRKQVASLSQDVSALQGLLGSLRIEVEDLRRQNRQLQDAISRMAAARAGDADILRQVDARIASLKAELLKEDADSRREVIASVKKQIDSLASQVEEALKKTLRDSTPRAAAPPQRSFSDEYPTNGIMYLVKPGDTISEIASTNKSRVNWIRDANKIADASRDLRAGDTIFVPQAE